MANEPKDSTVTEAISYLRSLGWKVEGNRGGYVVSGAGQLSEEELLSLSADVAYFIEQGYTIIPGRDNDGYFLVDPSGATQQYAATAQEVTAIADSLYQEQLVAYEEELKARFPWWDFSAWGDFPTKTETRTVSNPETGLKDSLEEEVPDWETAVKLYNTLKEEEPGNPGKLVDGEEVGAPAGTWWNVAPNGTISEWRPQPDEFVGFSEEEASAKLAQMGPGYQKYYDSQTDRWFIKQGEEARKTLPQGQQRVISEGGYDWAWDEETGDYTALVGKTPEKPRRSLDQIIEDYIISGNVDAAIALDTLRDQMDMPRGLTPAQAADLVMQWAGAPDEAREWIDALTNDWNSRRGEGEQVKSPSESLFGATTAAEKNALFPAGNYPSIDTGAGIPANIGNGAGQLFFPPALTGMGSTLPGGTTPPTQEQTGANGQLFSQGLMENIKQTLSGITSAIDQQTGKGVFQPPAFLGEETIEDEDERLRRSRGRGLFEPPEEPTLEEEDERLRKPASLFRTTSSNQQPSKVYYRFPQEMVRGQATSQEQFDTERQNAINAYQQMVADGQLSQAKADEYIFRMPPASADSTPPAESTKYYPGGLFAPSPWLKTQAQQSQPTPSALWKRGDVAPFERQLFGKQAPLSPQDALQQAWYRKWQKQRQRLFETQPVKTTLFR